MRGETFIRGNQWLVSWTNIHFKQEQQPRYTLLQRGCSEWSDPWLLTAVIHTRTHYYTYIVCYGYLGKFHSYKASSAEKMLNIETNGKSELSYIHVGPGIRWHARLFVCVVVTSPLMNATSACGSNLKIRVHRIFYFWARKKERKKNKTDRWTNNRIFLRVHMSNFIILTLCNGG